MGNGCTEQRHDAVTREVLHGATKGLDRSDDPCDRLLHDELELLGDQPFAQGGRTHDIGEQRGDDPPLLALLAHQGIVPSRGRRQTAQSAN
jgi:hypothetical protein